MIYYIPDVTHSTDDPKQGIVWLAQQPQDAKKVVIFSNKTVLETVFKSLGFADNVINGIIKSKTIVVSPEMSIPVATLEDGIPTGFAYGLVFYPNTDVLATLAADKGVKDLLVIPWAKEDLDHLATLGTAYQGSF